MKNRILKAIGGASLAILLLPVFGQMWLSAQDNGNGRTLAGSWDVQVTIRDCQTGTVLFGFPAMITYNQDGTVQQTDIGDPSFLRVPGHGVWERQNGRQYSAAFRFLNFTPDHIYIGRNVIRSAISLGKGGKEYNSTDTVDILDANGNLIVRACATTTATRFE
jgi:hypothetical protein